MPEPEPPAQPATNGHQLPPPREPMRSARMVGGAGATKPPLPRRSRQTNLAPQLATDTIPTGIPTEQPVSGEEDDFIKRSQRLRRNMTAFQQGTRQGRNRRPADRDG
jgi:hypothetical protein